MWCGGCARALEKSVGGLAGVSRVRAHLESASLSVDYDEAVVDAGLLVQRSASLGYRLSPVDWTGRREGDPLDREVRDLQFRLAFSAFWAMWLMLATIPTYSWGGQALFDLSGQELKVMGWAALGLSLPILLYGAAPFHRMAWRWIRVGLLGTDLLVSVGAGLSWILSLWALLQGRVELYCDALGALVIVLLWARLLQLGARQRSRQSLDRLLAEAPRSFRESKGASPRAVSEARVGTLFWLQAPLAVPLDGVVLEGEGFLEEALLTGEPLPRAVYPGDRVMAGTRLVEGGLRVSCSAVLGDRRLDELARGMRSAQARRGQLSGLSERAAVGVSWSLLLAGLATLLLGLAEPWTALERALAVLVVGCPCALTLAVPLVSHVVEGRAREEGIVFRDMRNLEALALARRFVFDKTGTLSCGRPSLCGVRMRSFEWSEARARAVAASAVHGSSHPLASALREGQNAAAGEGEMESFAGLGVRRRGVLVGSARFLTLQGVDCSAAEVSSCELAVDGRWVASFFFSDRLDRGALATVEGLFRGGYAVAVRSGDRPEALEALRQVKVEWKELSGGLSPEEKALGLDDEGTVFVGDGINDTLALSSAGVGVAVGSASATTVEAAGLQIRSVADLPRAMLWSRLAVRRMRLTLAASVAYNFALVPAAVLGWVSPTQAALAMALSSLTVVALAVGTSLPPAESSRAADRNQDLRFAGEA